MLRALRAHAARGHQDDRDDRTERTMIEIGKRAPAFTLQDQDGEKVKLSDYAGRWLVLYFYPRDDTPGCTIEACDFTAGIKRFGKLGASVVGVSPDSPESHAKFAAKHELELTLLSDPGHATMAKYGAWGEKTLYGKKSQGVIRSTVMIDPAGKIAHHWRKVQAKGHAEKVREKLAELAAG
jgi:peroxiredoxin Q/BCP